MESDLAYNPFIIRNQNIQKYCSTHKAIDVENFQPRLIGISGNIANGKGETFNLINQIIRRSSKVHITIKDGNNIIPLNYAAVTEKRFADYLKKIVAELTNIPQPDLDKFEIKNSRLPEEWNLDGKSMSVRELMTKLGNDTGRLIHPDIWCIATLKNFNPKENFWAISDLRYPNEVKWIKKLGGITIRVIRIMTFNEWSILFDFQDWLKELEIDREKKVTSEEFFAIIEKISTQHSLELASEKAQANFKASQNASETSLKNSDEYDIVLYNEGTLEELRDALYQELMRYTTK